MVGCKTDLDCMSRCGVHPISGQHYACTHNAQFYTHAGYSSEAYYAMKEQSERLKAAGRPHPKVSLVDPEDDSFYLIEEPGDDRWDIQRGTGVCTDTHLDYMHTGCNSVGGSKAMMAINGCTGRAFVSLNAHSNRPSPCIVSTIIRVPFFAGMGDALLRRDRRVWGGLRVGRGHLGLQSAVPTRAAGGDQVQGRGAAAHHVLKPI